MAATTTCVEAQPEAQQHDSPGPTGGYNTPSEPRSPSPQRRENYYTGAMQAQQRCEPVEGLMCIDQWDWKPDAPEFVPGRMKSLMVNAAAEAGGWAVFPAMPAAAAGRGGMDGGGRCADAARLTQIRHQYEWQLRSKSDELRELQTRMKALEIETAQVRASWDIERRNLVRQIGHFRAVLERYCIPLEEAGNFAAGQTGGGAGGGSEEPPRRPSRGEACDGMPLGAGGGRGPPVPSGAQQAPMMDSMQQPVSTLDSKMRKLNSLLSRSPASKDAPGTVAAAGEALGVASSEAGDADSGGYSNGAIASTLRAMFPHATIRTERRPPEQAGSEEEFGGRRPVPELRLPPRGQTQPGPSSGSPRAAVNGSGGGGSTAADEEEEAHITEEMQEIMQQLRSLERCTSATVDERAMRAFEALAPRDAREAVQKVQELVDAQGGQCRNLSSILQSVCRKIEKRNGKAARGVGGGGAEEEDGPKAGLASH